MKRRLLALLLLALGCGDGTDPTTRDGAPVEGDRDAGSIPQQDASTKPDGSSGDPKDAGANPGDPEDASSGPADPKDASTDPGVPQDAGVDASTEPGDPKDAGSDPKDAGVDPQACNGRVDLCARRFDDVVFPTTHNAHSAQEYGYTTNANQISGIQKQLEDGVRAMLMDVYDANGQTVLCHGSCSLASTPHRDALKILASFLAAHPREVIAIIYEDHLAVDRIAADIEATGLSAYVHTHPHGSAWPTLAEMIDKNERLVITAENGAPPPSWFHHVWDEAWDTPYTFRSQSDFTCKLNRGARANSLFLVNHWLNTILGLPSESGAKQVNTYDVLYGRAKGCWDEAGDKPNFVAVDFYEHGDLFGVVNALNDL